MRGRQSSGSPVIRGFGECEKEDISAAVEMLEEDESEMHFPFSSGVADSCHIRMRELCIQSGGRPIRIFYAFDPRRPAIPLIGGDKSGDDRFHWRFVSGADNLYDEH